MIKKITTTVFVLFIIASISLTIYTLLEIKYVQSITTEKYEKIAEDNKLLKEDIKTNTDTINNLNSIIETKTN